ncbi:hypothetical protein [Aquiflexum sp.]|uniref:hypothetical protein n=1 Tax=Aquiflexum sp. TaxID=1872584 RepID=UPI0035934040
MRNTFLTLFLFISLNAFDYLIKETLRSKDDVNNPVCRSITVEVVDSHLLQSS